MESSIHQIKPVKGQLTYATLSIHSKRLQTHTKGWHQTPPSRNTLSALQVRSYIPTHDINFPSQLTILNTTSLTSVD